MEILKSILILTLVSTFVSGCFYFLNFSFWPVFGLSFIFQIFIFNLFNNWKKQQAEIEFESILNERIKEFSKQGIECVCPDENCNETTFVPITLNSDNLYDCPKCKKEIKVLIGVKTFLKTTPVDEDPFKKFDFSKGIDYEQ